MENKRVELCVHTNNTAINGINSIGDFIHEALKDWMPAIAITDIMSLSSLEDGYEIVDRIPVKLDPEVRLRMSAHFGGEKEYVQFSYWKKNTNSWETIGKEQEVTFALDHFTGCRVGLFQMATENVGGIAKMREYVFTDL